MTETKYVGVIEGVDTWEVYQDGKLIGFNQSEPQLEEPTTP
jgi:hypothetical protein